ncbi:MAG: helix-turn-helix transcriptional regulator [Hyphomicrobiaceae bacterium]
MSKAEDTQTEGRRGGTPAEERYLRDVGDRVRLFRARRGMSRKILSRASGVSERFLAELERGAGNASLLVLRRIAQAMGLAVADLAGEGTDEPAELRLALQHLSRLSPAELAEASALLSQRFAPSASGSGRIALIGLRGAGKTTLGQRAAAALGLPFIELDREIERASGMEMAEIFAAGGQSAFRRLERECLATIITRFDKAVIATGGSIVAEPATYELLLSACHVVWLKAAPEQHMARVVAQGDLRPMADSTQAMEDLEAILHSRAALYARAHAEVDTSARDEAGTLAALLDVIRRTTADATAV